MDFNKPDKKTTIFIVFISILFFFAIQNISNLWNLLRILLKLLFPFILGGAIAFIFNVPMKVIEKKVFKKAKTNAKWKRPAAYLMTLVGVVAVIFITLFVVIPELIRTVNMLVVQIPKALEAIGVFFSSFEAYMPQLEEFYNQLDINWQKMTQDAIAILQSAASGLFTSTIGIVSGIVSGVATFFIAFTFSIYLLFQKENLCRQAKKIFFAVLPKERADRIIYIGRLTNTTFSNFLSGQCTEAVILGFLFFVTMSIFQLPYAVLIGVLIAVTALIPIFGAFIGLAVGAFLIVMVNPLQAFWFVVLFLVLQQLEGNLIYPYVVGGTVGLPSIWVLVAVTIGGKLMGIAGMLIFIPLCSVMYSLIRDFAQKQVVKKGIPSKLWEATELEVSESQSVSKKKKVGK